MGVSDIGERAVTWLQDLWRPTIRLGVTGLSRAGKTVFITALVHNLIRDGWLAFFDPVAEGRLIEAYLSPPDPAVDLFDFERYVAALGADPPTWPERTNSISELRIGLEYRPRSTSAALLGPRRINLDIVDYPGEWLLDLPLLGQSFETWSRGSIALAREPARAGLAAEWLGFLENHDPTAPHDTAVALEGSALFKAYLARCRDESHALSTLPPGRFLEPGGDAAKPMMHFMALDVPVDAMPPPGSIWREMARWYDAYKRELVEPFFKNHFARLDRQVVLIDLLRALNAGPAAVNDLEHALSNILACFCQGRNSWLSRIIAPRIDKVLFAATKADHLHAEGYDRLRAILGRLAERAMERAEHAGAEVGVEAVAAVRATRQAVVRQSAGQHLACIAGVPLPGETIDARRYDGREEAVIYPGELPIDPESALGERQNIRFVRFRPPSHGGPRETGDALPHIRLDRVLQFLIGDRMR